MPEPNSCVIGSGRAVAAGSDRRLGQKYLFSGLLVCGECGAHITIVAGNGKRAYPKYGCPNHRYRGTCSNRLIIRLDRLEAQLLAGLEMRVLSPESVEYVAQRLQDAMKAYCPAENAGTKRGMLEKEKSNLEGQALRVADAIAAAGHSPILLQRLSDIERKLTEVDRKIAELRPPKPVLTPSEIRDFVRKKLMNLPSLLRDNVARAKRELLEHVKEIVLTPVENMTRYAISGNWETLILMAGDAQRQHLQTYRGCMSQVHPQAFVLNPRGFS